MKKNKILIIGICLLLVFSCKLEFPEGPFSSLKNDEVVSPMSYFESTEFSPASLIEFEVDIPDDVKDKIVKYTWEIQNIFGDIIVTSNEASFSHSDFPPDEYYAILRIEDEEKNTKSFKKFFAVFNVEFSGAIRLTGIKEEQDSNIKGDNVTNVTENIILKGEAEQSNASLTLKLICVKDAYDKDFQGVSSADGNVEITVDEVLPDGTYECTLCYTEDTSIVSEPINVIIDNTAPTISWKKEEPSGVFSYGSEVVTTFSKISGSELLFGTNYDNSNDPALIAAESFDPYLCGTQILVVTALDKAGNQSNELTRSLTVEDVPEPVLKNGSFEAVEGTSYSYSSSDSGKGIAQDWTISGTVRRYYSYDEYVDIFSGTGPFRWNEGRWDEYYYCTVRNDDAHQGSNSLWFTEYRRVGLSKYYYAQAYGTASQEIYIKKAVPYKLSVWSKFGSSYIANPPGLVKVRCSDPEVKFTDVDGHVYSLTEVVSNFPIGGEWAETTLKFEANKDCTIELILEKTQGIVDSTNNYYNYGPWAHFDDVVLKTYGVRRIQ